MIFVDIQKSQIDEAESIIEQGIGEKAEAVPTVRARISSVNGESVDYNQKEVRQQQGQIGREFAITYRPTKEQNESIISGNWWPAGVNQP